MQLITEMAAIIYQQKGMKQPLSADVVNAQAEKLWDGVKKGYGADLPKLDYDTPDYNMMTSLKTDVWQFSAAKNWQERKAMTEALTGPDGKLRSLSEFKKAVQPIIGDHVKYLGTEYRTAVASSQMAAKWVDIQKNKETLPLLQFNAVMDNHTTELCRSLNDVIKPIDDAFWDSYYPPNHFNCRSDVRQLADGTITKDEDITYPELPKMFLTNVAKKGLIYPPGSSYNVGFPKILRKNAVLYMPEKEAYIPIYKPETGNGNLTAHLQNFIKKRDDWDDRVLLGKMLADDGNTVQILPEIIKEPELREKLLPNAISPKNPDYRINGEYADLKSPTSLKRGTLFERLKKGSEQADIVVMNMPLNYSGELNNYFREVMKQEKLPLKKIIVRIKDKLITIE